MKNEREAEIAADVRAKLEEIADHILKASNDSLDSSAIASLVEYFEEQTNIIEDYGWKMLLAKETYDEYLERTWEG